MTNFIAWVKLNPWKFAVAVLAVLVVLSGCVGLGCGYIKGCSDAKSKIESGK
jgi:hypothetical protein